MMFQKQNKNVISAIFNQSAECILIVIKDIIIQTKGKFTDAISVNKPLHGKLVSRTMLNEFTTKILNSTSVVIVISRY